MPFLLRSTLVHFADTVFFNKLKDCGNLVLSDDCQHFLATKYFLIKACTLCFRYNACILNRLQYHINITFICTGKPRNSHDSLYCDICFIAVVWNRTRNISEVCLCSIHICMIHISHVLSHKSLTTTLRVVLLSQFYW